MQTIDSPGPTASKTVLRDFTMHEDVLVCSVT